MEETAKNTSGEFNRQVRITSRTLRAIFNNRGLLNPFKYPTFSFALFSHKIIKFMLPFFMLTAFVSNLVLYSKGIFYTVTGLLQLMYYLLFCYGFLERNKENGNRIAGIAFTFGSVSFAYLMGWVKYFSGETYTTWSSERM